MVVGFNHNFRYRGEVYHIQTEDSGLKSPNIVTLLYHGGTILASKKTSYADIVRIDNLGQVVEELMKEQHKNMLRSLKTGEFDAVIERFQSGRTVAPQGPEDEQRGISTAVTAPVATEVPPIVRVPPAVKSAVPVVPSTAVSPEPRALPKTQPSAAVVRKGPSSAVEASLDEVILSYLLGDDK